MTLRYNLMLTRVLLFRMGVVEKALHDKLTTSFRPKLLEIVNESHRHSRGTETHFNVLIVS